MLTERAHTLRSHPGQVSFPGGRLDPDDDGSVAAALREAEEEVGLDPAGVEVLATFPDVFLAPSQHAVTPVLAWWPAPVPVGVVDRGEVERVLRVPVADLLDPGEPVHRRVRALPRAGLRGGRPVRVGLHRDAAEQPVRPRRAGGAVGRRPRARRCPTASCRRGCGGRAGERVGRARPRPAVPARPLRVERLAAGVRVGGARPGRAAGRGVPRRCASCPRLLEDHLDVYPATPVGVLALVAAVVAAALLGQGLMLLLARRFRDVVTAPAACARRLGARPRGGAGRRHARRVGGRRCGQRQRAPRRARASSPARRSCPPLDEIVPSSADGLVDELTQALDGSVFPKVFEGLGPEPIAPVEAPGRLGARPTRTSRGRWPRSCTCGPSPTPAARPRSAAAGSSPRAGSRPTPTSWPGPTASRSACAARAASAPPGSWPSTRERDVAVLEVRGPRGAGGRGRVRELGQRGRGRAGRVPGRRRAVGRRRPGARRAARPGRGHLRQPRRQPRDLLAARPGAPGGVGRAGDRPARRRGRHGVRDLARRPGHRLRAHPRRDRRRCCVGACTASRTVSTGECLSG